MRSWDNGEGTSFADFESEVDKLNDILSESRGFANSLSRNDRGDNKESFDNFLGGVMLTII